MAWAKYSLRGFSNLFFERDHHTTVVKKNLLIFFRVTVGDLYVLKDETSSMSF